MHEELIIYQHSLIQLRSNEEYSTLNVLISLQLFCGSVILANLKTKHLVVQLFEVLVSVLLELPIVVRILK